MIDMTDFVISIVLALSVAALLVITKQAHRILELVRRDRIRIQTAAGAVPVRQVSIAREDGKPTLVVVLGSY